MSAPISLMSSEFCFDYVNNIIWNAEDSNECREIYGSINLGTIAQDKFPVFSGEWAFQSEVTPSTLMEDGKDGERPLKQV